MASPESFGYLAPLLTEAWPIAVANTITLSLALAILAMKLRYR